MVMIVRLQYQQKASTNNRVLTNINGDRSLHHSKPNFRMFTARKNCLAACLCVLFAGFLSTTTEAFVPPSSPLPTRLMHQHATTTTSVLNERKWNFNEGQSPWGLKKNAEIWNGRVAQVRFPASPNRQLSLADACFHRTSSTRRLGLSYFAQT